MSIAARKISAESWIIMLISIVDLVLTCIWIHGESAYEGNPLMNLSLRFGIPGLVIAKLILVAGPIMIFEYARRTQPGLVKRMARFTIAAYLLIYGFLFVKVNVPTLINSSMEENSSQHGAQVDDSNMPSRMPLCNVQASMPMEKSKSKGLD